MNDNATISQYFNDGLHLIDRLLIQFWLVILQPMTLIFFNKFYGRFRQIVFARGRDFAGNPKVGKSNNNFLQRPPFMVNGYLSAMRLLFALNGI